MMRRRQSVYTSGLRQVKANGRRDNPNISGSYLTPWTAWWFVLCFALAEQVQSRESKPTPATAWPQGCGEEDEQVLY
jgi:hypothetical protein